MSQLTSPLALSPTTRAKRIAALTERLNELEQIEENYIRRAEDEDTTIARCLDADPCRILGVRIQPKPQVAKKPERTIDPAATAVA